MKRIIECVPNFSEGRDMEIINQITAAITSAANVRLLDVDPGEATNRTVVTFAVSAGVCTLCINLQNKLGGQKDE